MTTIQATFLVTGLVLLPAAGFAMIPAVSGRSGRSDSPGPRRDRAFAGILGGVGMVLIILAALLGAWVQP